MTDLAVSPAAEAMVDQWERQPGEPSAQFGVFALFRDMGAERGIVRMRDQNGSKWKLTTLARWAEKYRWVERAEAWDREVDRRKRQALLAEIEAQARRQVVIGQTLQDRGLRFIEEQLDTPEKRKANLTPTSALRYIQEGVALERKGLGVDDEERGTDVNVNVNVLAPGVKANVFAKIEEMHQNMRAVAAAFRPGASEEIIDAEVVEDAEE
jgi:hypothetical protein